jgi:hypothetical protein
MLTTLYARYPPIVKQNLISPSQNIDFAQNSLFLAYHEHATSRYIHVLHTRYTRETYPTLRRPTSIPLTQFTPPTQSCSAQLSFPLGPFCLGKIGASAWRRRIRLRVLRDAKTHEAFNHAHARSVMRLDAHTLRATVTRAQVRLALRRAHAPRRHHATPTSPRHRHRAQHPSCA